MPVSLKNAPADKEEQSNKKKSGLIIGLVSGLIVALLAVGGVGALFFRDQIKGLFTKAEEAGPLASNGETVEVPESNMRATVITKKDCVNCWDVNIFLDPLQSNNVKLTDTETVYVDDAATQALIDKYQITKVPTVLLSGDLDKNPNLSQAWPILGEVIDNVFVLRQVIPHYYDLASQTIKGKVSVVYLADQSCDKCYDVTLHGKALANYGLVPDETKTVDIASAEGKELIKKYDITAAPTILFSGEIEEYQSLAQDWSLFGKVTDDGTYIFTKMDEMGTYKDLKTNKVVVVEASSTAATVEAQ